MTSLTPAALTARKVLGGDVRNAGLLGVFALVFSAVGVGLVAAGVAGRRAAAGRALASGYGMIGDPTGIPAAGIEGIDVRIGMQAGRRCTTTSWWVEPTGAASLWQGASGTNARRSGLRG